MEKKNIKVGGMSCQHCVKTVKQTVSALAGVKNVKVELKSGDVSFSYDPAKTDISEISSAITAAGYTVDK